MRGPGFSYARNMDGSAYVPSLIYIIGANGVTFTIGDPVRVDTAGFIALADAVGDEVCGIVAQVVDANGLPLTPVSSTLHDYLMPATNETGATYGYQIGFIPALANYLFFNDASADLTQIMEFQFFNIVAGAAQIDQTTATDTANETYRLIERDPDSDADLSKGLFQIVESQLGQISMGRTA